MRYLIPVLISLLITVNGYSKNVQNENLPIVIESQKLTYDNKKKVAHYIGSVIAQHGQTIITGDELTIYFDPTGRHIRKIVVKGHVHIKDPRGEGWCNELIYYPFEDKVVLIGDAKLKQKENLLIGDKIIAYRSGKVSVEGIKQKVKSVIYPEEVKSGESKRP
ncbi:MAG: lipopolysaccharide transport periplasmic protein LptA [Thermovibrio sp.]|nr:MAG: lipopolysaccharide transport periplasmic protein LptA [Thermovibrio sp.]